MGLGITSPPSLNSILPPFRKTKLAGKLVQIRHNIPPPTWGQYWRGNLNQRREKWGQEVSCDRWVSYRLLWAVHPTSLPQSLEMEGQE